MRVAVLGAGIMGAAMAKNIAAAGHVDLVGLEQHPVPAALGTAR